MAVRSFVPLALLLGVVACAAPRQVIFPPAPSGYTALDGVDLQNDPRAPVYVLDTVTGPKGKELWLGVHPADDITPFHSARRLDAHPLPAFADDAVLILGDCSVDGTPDFEVIALADRPRTEAVTRIRRAWRADRGQGRIVKILGEGITCWMAQPRYCAGADLTGTDSVAMAGHCAALFIRKNWFTQGRGEHADQVSLDSGDAGTALDTVILTRHATFEMEPAEVWCHGDSCGATFRYLGRNDCAARLVVMDRDFGGLRLLPPDLRPAPGIACVPRPPVATIPVALPDSDGRVTVSGGRAVFIFPVIPDTGAGWPDFATTASNYQWQAAVGSGDSTWIVFAQIYRPTPATPSASFSELVRKSFVGVVTPGRYWNEDPQAVVQAEGSGGRAVIAVNDEATVRRLFRSQPSVVKLYWCTPYGRCGEVQARVRYGE